MNKRTLLLTLFAATFLSACVAPQPKLAPGSTVTFVNRVEPTFKLLRPAGIFRTPTITPIPNGSAMMKAIVMEEAAKAGVRCSYLENPYEVKLSIGIDTQDVREAKAFAAASSNPVTMVMTPVSLMNNYDAAASGGFVLNHFQSLVGPGLVLALTTSDIRLDDVNGRKKVSNMTFGHGKSYKGFAGKLSWDTTPPATKAKAMQIFALLFRAKVAQLFGNPPPVVPPELDNEATEL